MSRKRETKCRKTDPDEEKKSSVGGMGVLERNVACQVGHVIFALADMR